jgi:magnesium-protoporphyrin O-methyltransferase
MFVLFAFLLSVCTVTSFKASPSRYMTSKSARHMSSAIDDKVEVEEYFNNEGFGRWNKIYSDSDEVNKVQKDIRDGHQQTIDKVIGWMDGESNKGKTLCDAGCGVGSLALPLAPTFKKVYASDISAAMTGEAARRAKASGLKNLQFTTSDMEKLSGKYDTVTCIDVMIHYPTPAMYDIVQHLGSISKERLILSFAPKNIFYDLLKKVGEFFPGPSKTTRAYLHPEEDVVKALKMAGFTIKRKEMTGTNFYFSRLLEAVKE